LETGGTSAAADTATNVLTSPGGLVYIIGIRMLSSLTCCLAGIASTVCTCRCICFMPPTAGEKPF